MHAGEQGRRQKKVPTCMLFSHYLPYLIHLNILTAPRPDYLPLDGSLNWQTFNDSQLDLCTGITLHLCPGHTPGLCIMQVNLPQDGTFIWTTDQFHVRENYEKNHAQGWLLRDHKSWMDSTNFIRRLQRLYSATLIFGHDLEAGTALIQQKPFYQ